MSDPVMNEMHGPHCEGKYQHCSCNECHGRPVEERNYAPDAREECGHHCIGHFCTEDASDGNPCMGRFSENSNIHCRCVDCHNIPDVSLSKIDQTVSFSEVEI